MILFISLLKFHSSVGKWHLLLGLIIAFKSKLAPPSMTESKTTDILERALLFASRAKLGEIFFESIPQFLTQLMMTSAKGQGGIRELTLLQMISVMTSAINIAFGISKFVIDSRGQGRRRNYFFLIKYDCFRLQHFHDVVIPKI